MAHPYQVAAYYFPNYHLDPRNAAVHGPGWTEWELLKRAVPRYPGQRQPRVPVWGYEDESDPVVMARKIAAAAEHGVDAFLFDWYWYDDGPFLQRGLEQGFLGAANNSRLKFAIMWANHNWTNIHPAGYAESQQGSQTILYPGGITRQTFESAARHVIDVYFKYPSYWKIDGAPYFSIYDLPEMLRSLDGFAGLRDALAWFRAETKPAGFPNLHLNQVYWNVGILPGEAAIHNPSELMTGLGFDSITSYVWIHHAQLDNFPETDYAQVCQEYLRFWENIEKEINLPYFPNATMGWDSSPRTVQSETFAPVGYPFMPVLGGNTPAGFKAALQTIKEKMDQKADPGPKILTINAWNEWTEGSYLEPDTLHGLGYLEAIREVFR
ncbi:MAG: hypothetical protein EHM81_00320 [Chloroflexi bacterium]|nr:MAG: hypothetical protein EHM81_00320 [Chloroflexota bacterium]